MSVEETAAMRAEKKAERMVAKRAGHSVVMTAVD